MRNRIAPASIAFLLAACDQLATAQTGAQAPQPAATAAAVSPRADAGYLEGETCTRSDDCPLMARCVSGTCLPNARTLMGEVLTERGTRDLATNRFQEGAEAFRAAQQAYTSHGIPVPAAVSCGLARALMGMNDRGGGGNNDAREGMARSLATCLGAAAPGSTLSDQAVAGLVSLADRGLDPAALDRSDAALMTGQDPRPTADNTHVRLTFSGQGDGARATFRDFVNNDALRGEIVRCFLQWWSNSHQTSDQGTLRISYNRGLDDYEELMPAHLAVAPVEVAPVEGNDAGTHPHWLQCAQLAVQNAAQDLRWPAHQERWSETLAVSVGPN